MTRKRWEECTDEELMDSAANQINGMAAEIDRLAADRERLMAAIKGIRSAWFAAGFAETWTAVKAGMAIVRDIEQREAGHAE